MQIADQTPTPTASPAAAHSRFWQRLHRRYTDVMGALPPGPPDRAAIEQALQQLQTEHRMELSAALRVLRQLVMERLMTLDCAQQADLSVITSGVTTLAELALDRACLQARQELDARYGPPLGPEGLPVPLWIIGMGKLGARELNVSSDIDLIYVYEHEGETQGLPDGRGKISNHEYFGKTVRASYTLSGDPTEHGFGFRGD